MDRLRSILRDLTLVTYAVAGVFLSVMLYRMMGTVALVNKTITTVNAPCTSFHGSVSCGVLSQMSQTEKNVGILAAQGAEQVKQNGALVQSTTKSLDTLTGTINQRLPGLFDHADGSLTGIDTATARVPPLIDAATDRINGLQPLEDALTKLVSDTDTRTGTTFADLKTTEAHIDELMTDAAPVVSNLSGITFNLAASTADFQTKFHAYLFPPPCKTFWCKLARLWPYIRGAASMAESVYWTKQLFTP